MTKQKRDSPLSTAIPAGDALGRLRPPINRMRTSNFAALALSPCYSQALPGIARALKTQRLHPRGGKKNLPLRSAATESATPQGFTNGRITVPR